MYHCLVSLVDGQLKSTTSSQLQPPTQTPRPAAVPSSGASSVPTLLQSSFHWSHAFLAVGLLAASGAGTAVLFKVLGANLFLYLLYPLSTSCDNDEHVSVFVYRKLPLILMFLLTGYLFHNEGIGNHIM